MADISADRTSNAWIQIAARRAFGASGDSIGNGICNDIFDDGFDHGIDDSLDDIERGTPGPTVGVWSLSGGDHAKILASGRWTTT